MELSRKDIQKMLNDAKSAINGTRGWKYDGWGTDGDSIDVFFVNKKDNAGITITKSLS